MIVTVKSHITFLHRKQSSFEAVNWVQKLKVKKTMKNWREDFFTKSFTFSRLSKTLNFNFFWKDLDKSVHVFRPRKYFERRV